MICDLLNSRQRPSALSTWNAVWRMANACHQVNQMWQIFVISALHQRTEMLPLLRMHASKNSSQIIFEKTSHVHHLSYFYFCTKIIKGMQTLV